MAVKVSAKAARKLMGEDALVDGDIRPGRVICEGTVAGRAVPWKSPSISKTGGVVPTRGYTAYKAWQEAVAAEARRVMGRRKPYAGPVRFEAAFYLRHKGTPPDVCNLAKSTEDSLQGIAFVNDRQVAEHMTRRVITSQEPERVEFKVVSTDKS